ncbi:uncharacterized protein BYT42DRAFT_544265 [Radiomyces spectabilis]|uniref:uncharacterized protein n=1 Tax=Radiomyces spectabilis TaxID=64574 RepID=UPI00221EE6B7|nr:uncharacterized protein BYT42DRAFT_544265 [Radiomyces spectabilis]KAI8384353.1 hypothetical protein BYT42DRAFT_544265 [Radiomyces spectabilis]
MREPNFSFPAQHRAAVVITSSMYDRRALDCTATLPLVNSLTHLAYMTSTSPRIREILSSDGGMERLIKILATCQHTDKHSLWKWSLAFQCVVNVGVRGTEAIRTRVVDAGAVHIVLVILENFLKALERAKMDKEQEHKQIQNLREATALTLPTMPLQPPQTRSTPITPSRRFFGQFPSPVNTTTISSSSPETNVSLFTTPKRYTFLTRTLKTKPKHHPSPLLTVPFFDELSTEAILHREEDVLLSLQLLAYLSKYAHIRHTFHHNYHRNVFSVVERFTHRLHPAAIVYWAGVIMRNACRKDETRGGIRQCANMLCGKWERFPREFAKCRRCRKAKYCSKPCQSKAWADGHRWWCVERIHSSQPPTATTTSATVAAAAAAVVAGDPQPAPPVDQVVSLDDTRTPDAVAITIDNHDGNIPVEEVNTTPNNMHRRSSLQLDAANLHSPNNNDHGNMVDRPRQESLLFYRQRRRNSRSARSLASGSSTEVEAENETSRDRGRDFMDTD